MTTPDDQPMAPGRRRVRPYAMTGGRTRPTHDDLEIEALVSTTSIGEQTAKLTVEQRAIAALCHDILSIAEVSAQLHLPPGRHPGPGWRHGRPEPGHRPPARPSWRPSRPGPAGAGAVRAAHHLTATCSSQPRIGDASKAAVAADTAGCLRRRRMPPVGRRSAEPVPRGRRTLGTTQPSASSFIGQMARHQKVLTNVRPDVKPGLLLPERRNSISHADRHIRSLVLSVGLVGSGPICPAHVGCVVGRVGCRRNPLDRLDDQVTR
jgi:Protein of unknown function (DUF742)